MAIVWLRRGSWNDGYVLDGTSVSGITPFLTVPGTVEGKPYRLAANAGKSFQGSNVLGMGFVLTPEEAEALIANDPRNRDVLFPYLNGEDLNSRWDQSPSRWVINFHDWPLDRENARTGYHGPVAADYADCLRIVGQKVRPERAKLAKGDATARDRARRWWQFARPTINLYAAIAGMETVLVVTQTAKHQGFVRVPGMAVYSHKLVVFGGQDASLLGLVSCSLHREWFLQHGSTLESRPVYAPSDCFETFAFPPSPECLDSIGQRYDTHRRLIMATRREGLTATYNRFHSPDERSLDIVELREIHVEMDLGVATAYGWADLNLGHNFRETRQGTRFTVSDSARREILARLLALNHTRYSEEVAQGLHENGKRRGRRPLPVANPVHETPAQSALKLE